MSDNQERPAEVPPNLYAAAVLTNEWEESELGIGNLRDRIAAALDAAEQRGRESVGLGDFLPDPCGDEYSNYPWYIAETYGDYVTCNRRSGHDSQHEHSDSGMTWSTREDHPATPSELCQ